MRVIRNRSIKPVRPVVTEAMKTYYKTGIQNRIWRKILDVITCLNKRGQIKRSTFVFVLECGHKVTKTGYCAEHWRLVLTNERPEWFLDAGDLYDKKACNLCEDEARRLGLL